MDVKINDALIDELSTLDCVKRYLTALDAEGNITEKTFTVLEKQDAIRSFVLEELKQRLFQKRQELGRTESDVATTEVFKSVEIGVKAITPK